MSGRAAWNQTKTIALVSFITGLVWLMAEGESLRTEKIRPDVHFRAKADSARIVKVDSGQEFGGSVMLTLEGPTAAVDALRERARGAIELEPGMEAVPPEPGRHTVNLLDALRACPPFRDSSVTITAVEPPSVTISVDMLVSRDVGVRVETPEGTLLDAVPETTPATVAVRLPESASKAAGDFQAIARLTPEMLATVPAWTRSTVKAPLTLPPAVQGEGARVTPAEVTVTVLLRSRVASTVVPGVPVYLRLAPAEMDAWDIEILPEGRVIGDVTVSGPSELVEQVKSGKIKIIAYVPLTSEELERAGAAGVAVERDVVYCDMPTLLRFEARQKTVKLTVHRREMGPPAGR